VMPILAVWLNGVLFFAAGQGTRGPSLIVPGVGVELPPTRSRPMPDRDVCCHEQDIQPIGRAIRYRQTSRGDVDAVSTLLAQGARQTRTADVRLRHPGPGPSCGVAAVRHPTNQGRGSGVNPWCNQEAQTTCLSGTVVRVLPGDHRLRPAEQTHASKTHLTYLGLSVTPAATESEPRTEP